MIGIYSLRFLASGSSGNCALVSDGTTNILIDAGISVTDIATAVDLKSVDVLLVTHSHFDHSKYALKLSERYQIPIYALKETLLSCLETSLFEKSNHGQRDISADMERQLQGNHLFRAVRGGFGLEIGSLRIIPIELKHDVPCCGYFICNEYRETLVWVADTSEVSVDIEADIYCIEANYDEDTLDKRGEAGEVEIGVYGRLISEGGHLSLQKAAAYIQANAKSDSAIILHHVSQNNGFMEERAKEVFGRDIMIVPAHFEHGVKCPF